MSNNDSTGQPHETRYVRPGWFTTHVFNRFVRFLTRRGLSVSGSRELRVRGRKSGEWRTTPVNLLELDGERYLVAPRGVTQWVRNIRVAGGGELRVGRRIEPIQVVELADSDKNPVIRAYVKRWAWEVGAFFENLDANSPEENVTAAAPGFPVFRVLSA
jgi:deazaflavin-dependent oxidoreductase (nitroreductase family)